MKRYEYKKDPWVIFQHEEAPELRSFGATKEEIHWYFKHVARDSIKKDIEYDEHNLPLYGREDDVKRSLNTDKGSFSCWFEKLGIKEKADKKCKSNPSPDMAEPLKDDWYSIKLCIYPLAANGGKDAYMEYVEVTEPVYSEELHQMLDSLSGRRKLILKYMLRGYSQTQIARSLNISNVAVCKHVKYIRSLLESYSHKKGLRLG